MSNFAVNQNLWIMFRLFIEGGIWWMGLITIELIALFLAAWKAPAWVKEIGGLALITGILSGVIGLSQAGAAVHAAGDISPALIWGGIRVMCIALIYGLLVYAVSLIIRIIQKPRML